MIARGAQFDGQVELVAYGWAESCLTRDEPRGDDAVEIRGGTTQLGPPRFRWSEICGRMSPSVATVRVSVHRRGSDRTRRVKATVAHGVKLDPEAVSPLHSALLDLPAAISEIKANWEGMVERWER